MPVRIQEIETSFFTPRPYQLELVDKAKSKNLIIPLGTGTGKTFIAVMLIKELALELRLDIHNGGKRSFFLVNTVILVEQQAEQIRSHSNLEVGEYSGAKRVDLWDKETWMKEIDKNHVMVMTAQIFLDLLSHGYWSLERTNLVIIDECHHARKDHVYSKIMKHHFFTTEPSRRPKVLGLTASVVNDKCNPLELKTLIGDLERNLGCSVETASDLVSLSQYGAKPRIQVVKCGNFSKTALIRKVHRNVISACAFIKDTNYNSEFEINPTKPALEAMSRFLQILAQLGPWCAWKVAGIQERTLDKYDRTSVSPDQELFSQFGITYMRLAKTMLMKNVRDVRTIDELMQVLPPKVGRLLEILRYYRPKNWVSRRAKKLPLPDDFERQVAESSKNSDSAASRPKNHQRSNRDKVRKRVPRPRHGNEGQTGDDFCGIIFVEQRYIAYILKILIKTVIQWDPDMYGYLKPDFVVGFSSGGPKVTDDEKQSMHKRQEEVLRNFRHRQLNLLIATSVLEEGVDVRQCNCVIRYDLPNDYRAYIQSKGRARKAGSNFYLLAEESRHEDFVRSLHNFQQIEKILTEYCRTEHNPPVERFDPNDADNLVPAYAPPLPEGSNAIGQPRVTMSTAMELVNRYCARLPSDVFTRLAPRCHIYPADPEPITGDELAASAPLPDLVNYVACIALPINSPVKQDIKGPRMRTRKFAQMAVALETCKILHQAGELDDHLLPVGKEALKYELLIMDDDDDDVWPEDGRARPGSIKRRQYYTKRVSDWLLNPSMTSQLDKCYLHLIEMTLNTPAVGKFNPKQRRITDPKDSKRQCAILSTKMLPKIPVFSVFTRQGEVTISMNKFESISIDRDQLTILAKFHRYIFSDLLRLEKYSMRYDPFNVSTTLFVCPVVQENNRWNIDWSFVEKCIAGNSVPKQPTEDEREKFMFDENRFTDSIVTPWYRSRDHPTFYYVAEICYDRSPACPFPDVEYASFKDYFMQKYGLPIYCVDQPLLDVDYTSGRLNLLTPRYLRKKDRVMAVDDEDSPAVAQKQYLIPELVDIHPMNGSFWNLVICLPSVLYRLNHLLLANEFRMEVQMQVFRNTQPILMQDDTTHQWEPMEFWWQKLGSQFEGKVFSESGETMFVDQTFSRLCYTISEDHMLHTSIKKKDRARVTANYAKDTSKLRGESLTNGAAADGDFVIDVWKPELADSIPPYFNSSMLNDTPIQLLNGDLDKLAGQGQRKSSVASSVVMPPDQLGSEESESEDPWKAGETDGNIYFDIDMKHYMLDQSGFVARPKERQQPATANRDDRPTAFNIDLFAPREPVVPLGWGDVAGDFLVPEAASATGLQFLSVEETEIFDPDALLDDIIFQEQAFRTAAQRPQNGLVPINVPGVPVAEPPVAVVRTEVPVAATAPLTNGYSRPTVVELVDDEPVSHSSAPTTSAAVDADSDGLATLAEICRDDIDVKASVDTLDVSEFNYSAEQPNSLKSSSLKDINFVDSDQPLNLMTSDTGDTIGESVSAAESDRTSVLPENVEEKNAVLIKALSEVKAPDLSALEPIPFSFEVDHLDKVEHGPNPSFILQALTMSNANDGMNLERLETVGDSFLKYAITVYLFITHPDRHEGKLSFLRSKQVSNFNLYKLGKRKRLGDIMVASKFEPTDNWLPPCFRTLDAGQDDDDKLKEEEDRRFDRELDNVLNDVEAAPVGVNDKSHNPIHDWLASSCKPGVIEEMELLPYNLLTQHSIPDKSIADAVEALIGVYLLTYGPRGALMFMQWVGLRVLPDGSDCVGPPRPPLLQHVENPEGNLMHMWHKHNFTKLESVIGYRFKHKAYLVQAFTHASYHYNRVTDCYQRLEFLGDAVLDYLITRHLYEDKRQHPPGVLTDLRSALVNNTIFASLAVKYEFHKYFLALCPGLFGVIHKFVKLQIERSQDVNFDEELYLMDQEDDVEDEEDIEVPKALGDIFESIAGAVYLDSGYSLDAVWKVYFTMMGDTLEKCQSNPPRSPIRELLELEPELAKFSRPERIFTEGKVRVTVDVVGKGRFTGVGRNYRIAKSTAAKRALRFLKQQARKEKLQNAK